VLAVAAWAVAVCVVGVVAPEGCGIAVVVACGVAGAAGATAGAVVPEGFAVVAVVVAWGAAVPEGFAAVAGVVAAACSAGLAGFAAAGVFVFVALPADVAAPPLVAVAPGCAATARL